MAGKTREQWQKEWEEYEKDRAENYISELVPLTRDEAIAAMKAGETLENGKDPYHLAHYHWYEYTILNEAHFLESDSWYDLAGDGNIIPEEELPQLYRRIWKKKDNPNGENQPQIETSQEEKPSTWAEIENTFKNYIQNGGGEMDDETLAYFKRKILAHLDNLQAKEDKKILPFPKANQKKDKPNGKDNLET